MKNLKLRCFIVLYHILKSLEQNDLIDDDFKELFLSKENIELANRFHRVEECGRVEKNEFRRLFEQIRRNE